ncbi:MAG: hypothetical protein AB1586_02770 [Pseudomonadota bacterium]
MCDENLPIDPKTILPMSVEHFADTAIDAAIWLVRESLDAIANKTAFDPDPENCFKVLGGPPAVRELRDLTEDQRHDMFIEGFRRIPHGAHQAFELLLSHHKEMLWEAFRARWSVIANQRS